MMGLFLMIIKAILANWNIVTIYGIIVSIKKYKEWGSKYTTPLKSNAKEK